MVYTSILIVYHLWCQLTLSKRQKHLEVSSRRSLVSSSRSLNPFKCCLSDLARSRNPVPPVLPTCPASSKMSPPLSRCLCQTYKKDKIGTDAGYNFIYPVFAIMSQIVKSNNFYRQIILIVVHTFCHTKIITEKLGV